MSKKDNLLLVHVASTSLKDIKFCLLFLKLNKCILKSSCGDNIGHGDSIRVIR